jgi:non-specific serine/threonine protein kinase
MEHGSPDDGLLVVTALWRLWHMRLDVAEGRELLTRLLDHRTTLSESCLAIALIVASDLAQNQGDYPAAAALGEEGLSLARATGDTRATGLALAVIGTNERVQGKADEAIDRLTEALTIVEALDDRPSIAQTLWMLGDIHRERGDIGAGRAMLESSLAIARSIDDVWQVAWSLGYLADTARTAGEHEQSLYLDQEGLVLQRDLKSTWGIVGGITGLAMLAATWDQSERAARLLGARASLRSKLGMPLVWPMHRHWYDPLIRKLRQDIGSDAFDAIWAEGAALTVDQVVAEGLKVAMPETSAPTPSGTGTNEPRSGLSPRELEVLRLIVDGRSNREIGDNLFISTRTVATHVAHILSKLGLDSRAAAAAYAVRNGIA